MSKDDPGTRAIPGHFQDPVGLAARLLRSGGSHGRFSLLAAGLSVPIMPLDRALRSREQQLRAETVAPVGPVALVCGPARSGTTIMVQILLRATSAAYITNLMDMFHQSPLAASRVFRVRPRAEKVPLTSHYGRMAGFARPNDGLSIWDHWLGSDRTSPDGSRVHSKAADINGFFGGLERWTGRFVATKANSLNAVASDVGEVLTAAQFICMERDDVYLAQSLLVARSYIQGDPSRAYGLHDASKIDDDVIEDVAKQVRYNRDLAARQVARLGSERFRIIEYERLCSEPRVVVTRLAEALDVEVDLTRVPHELPVSKRVSIDRPTFDRLRERLSA